MRPQNRDIHAVDICVLPQLVYVKKVLLQTASYHITG